MPGRAGEGQEVLWVRVRVRPVTIMLRHGNQPFLSIRTVIKHFMAHTEEVCAPTYVFFCTFSLGKQDRNCILFFLHCLPTRMRTGEMRNRNVRHKGVCMCQTSAYRIQREFPPR
ncbi:hypothetical protein J6590_051268 [Homalodisca vitripennis]|nr:hypothetical protein J6590_051268 [Homalodisca vitripennis]